MALTIYPDGHSLTKLGIRDSVMYLLNQLGWHNFAVRRRFRSYCILTLEFLSSLSYDPTRGIGFNKGLITFRLFGIDYRYNHHELAELLGFPNGPDIFTIRQEEVLMELQLDYFLGSITRNNHPEPNNMFSVNIHNQVICYFHKILAHTLFEREENIPFVSRDELFILFCAFQSRKVNAATFMLANLNRIAHDAHAPIIV